MTSKFSENILKWYKVHGRKDLPWKVNDPYKIWISEIMLQQTQVSTVIPYYKKFVKKYPSLESLSKANYDDLMLLWSGLGYYR
ncbi:MAG: A/G-specific adenine glycosylase, partial [Gammaproteobacteria bacterium]